MVVCFDEPVGTDAYYVFDTTTQHCNDHENSVGNVDKKKRPKNNVKILTLVDVVMVKSRLVILTVLALEDTDAELEFMARKQ